MRIKKIYQGSISANKILNAHSTSQTDTYSCEYLNDKLVVVSATEPTENREKIWIQKGKNLLNKDVGFTTDAFISNTGEISTATNNALFNGYISIKSSTIYTISTNTNITFAFSFYDKNYNFIERDIATSTKVFSYTAPSNAVYMRIHINMSSTITQDIIDGLDIMLEQNATATTYEAYVESKIYCLNDNNVYEEFINKEDKITLWEGSSLASVITLNDNPNNYKYFIVETSLGYSAIVSALQGGSAVAGKSIIENSAYNRYEVYFYINTLNNTEKTIQFAPTYIFKNGSFDSSAPITKIIGVR